MATKMTSLGAQSMIERLMISVLLLLTTQGCGVTRDDTTGATRQIVSNLLGVNYSDVKPTTTLGELGCDELDIVELIMEMEETFDISISEDEFDSLGTPNDQKSVTILELANLARSKREF
jgi:acyl carrier protein